MEDQPAGPLRLRDDRPVASLPEVDERVRSFRTVVNCVTTGECHLPSVQTPSWLWVKQSHPGTGIGLSSPGPLVVWWTCARALPCYAQSGESLRDLDEAPWSNVDGRRPSEGRLGTYDELLAGLASARRPAVDNRCCILTRHPCAKGLATLRAARKRVGPMLAVEFPWPSDRGESRMPPLRLRWG